MAKQTINIGTVANDGTGDPLRTAFDKANDNFTEVYSKPDLTLAANNLTLTKADGTTDTVDLSTYLDEDARAISSGTLNAATGIVTFTRDDASTFTLDLSGLLDDTVANDATITLIAGSGLTGGGDFTTNQSSAETITLNVNVDDSTIEISGDSLQLKSGGIDEVHLNSTNVATDNYILSYDSASGGFTWVQQFDGDITSVVAGDGLTGGATVGDATINVGGGTGITVAANSISTNDSEIVHDNLSGFVANEHINHTSVTLTAGNGLTGGGDISASRTFDIGEGTGITVSANAIATNDSEIVHDNLSGFVANEHIDHSTLNITAGDGLSGGGDLTASRELYVNVDDSTIEISSDIVQVKDDGITYAKMGTEFTTAAVISASDVDFSSAAVFTKTLSANTTLTFSNVQTGMVKDLVITGDFTLTLPASVKTITGTYDGTVSNLIQIVSTNGSTEQWATISQEA